MNFENIDLVSII